VNVVHPFLSGPLADYDPKNPTYSHFKQVVWKSTTQVGCAVATCSGIFDASAGVSLTVPSLGGKKILIICL
jgi:hypothetical protein